MIEIGPEIAPEVIPEQEGGIDVINFPFLVEERFKKKGFGKSHPNFPGKKKLNITFFLK